MKTKILILLCIVMCIQGYAQPRDKHPAGPFPEIGKQVPDFVLKNIRYYSKNIATANDFKGRWLVLDFWNKGCGACVASFPRISAEQKEFDGKVQYMMVGIEDPEKQIEPMFAKYKEKENLAMPCAFDSTLAYKWDIFAAPYIIVINPDGIVKAVTVSLSSASMHALIEGKNPRLEKTDRMHEERKQDDRIKFDNHKPLNIHNNGGVDSIFLFRSLLTAFNIKEQRYYKSGGIDDGNVRLGSFQALGIPIERLYCYAYFSALEADSGYERPPIVESRDSGMFVPSFSTGENLYCYSLILPPAKASKEKMQKILQNDLQNYFGYEAVIEKREFPCLQLVTTGNAKKILQTKGGLTEFKQIIAKADFSFQNEPFGLLVQMIKNYLPKEIIDDQTTLTGNIDITMHCIADNVEEMRKALQDYGLDLVPGKKAMRVLVIKDKK